jgi:fibronectin type 3 domain-containing protein
MLNVPVRANIYSILTVFFMLTQMVACSSEENLGGTGAGIGTGSVTTPTIPSLTLVSWVSPSEREDNSPISLAEIAGYRIYYGSSQGDYPNQIDINDAYDNDVDTADLNLPAGTYYAVVTTIDTDGRESAFSEEVTLNI